MDSNPALWLHLAECCVTATKRSNSHKVKHLYQKTGNGCCSDNEPASEPMLSSVGTGVHRKVVVKTPVTQQLPTDTSSPQLTLDYASQCLKNALRFCGQAEVGNRPAAAAATPTSSSPRGNGNSSSANSSAQASPVKSISSIDKSILLRGSILANSAYVALCLRNPVAALESSESLLEFNQNGILVSFLFLFL